ncbi:N-6 DNA methylase [Paludisphaera borealis]|uniref:DNA methylase adenine-specific domain-containing protein n=1 Tax=Paludisphaera borealis TaxID=1387353 RepID=A0A1U7CZ82_9BACT|nr:N-6 DNA methylase [Paludisphaera borealis]APW64221.1 hypothetical protein BSF38_05813 [Paludisphaera borealis]
MSTGTTPPNLGALAKHLSAYGCTDIIRLDEKLTVPEQLDYLDLLPTRVNETPKLAAVAAHQGTALLYVIDATDDAAPLPSSLASISRQLANRSDPAWLGVVKPGSLEIFPIGFHENSDLRPVKTIEERDAAAPLFFQSLVHGTFEENQRLKGTDYVYQKIFDLLMRTTEAFVPKEGTGKIDALDVLSMSGRALFFRFLIDRDIVRASELVGPEGICPSASGLKDTFSSAENTARTSAWLDATFNGDFLPLIDESIPADDIEAREAAYLKFYTKIEGLVGGSIFQHLHAILRGWKVVGGGIQMELDWGDFDFAHIPVGVLSQVYESFSHRADPRTARDTSVHYTPRTIASFMVDEAFAALKEPSQAVILDSACGAGIFLVLAYRRLVRERWMRDGIGNRPKTTVIQSILYNQIRGFDISESALRLAALALYITAIELNATTRPSHTLKFPRNLRGEVLYRFGDTNSTDSTTAFLVGSLGSEVPARFDGTFDIVIGNPPWTRLRDDAADEDDQNEPPDDEVQPRKASASTVLNRTFTDIARHALKARGFEELAARYENPDKNPDLPFLWRATGWAKQGGVIALAMHARLFMRTKGKGWNAWRSILHSLQITGLLNGSDLRKTAVWEGIDVPWCLIFARNAVPTEGHRFQYSAPIYEPNLNGWGRLRIDYEAAHQIGVERAEKLPWLLKTLAIGTRLDVELMQSLVALNWQSLGDYWDSWDKSGTSTGKGYDRSPRLKQKHAQFLGPLLDFRPSHNSFTIQFQELITYFDRYGISTAHMPRTEQLYRPPLVVVPQSPGDKAKSPRAYLSDHPIAFSQSYYGYSCAGHPQAELLAAILYLLPHSTLFAYFCLMTSRRSGFDRQTFNKDEFDAMPFPSLAGLPPETKARVQDIADRLQHAELKPWNELDELVFQLYGLDKDAVQVATDTLFAAVSYRKAGKAALQLTDRPSRTRFVAALHDDLEPYFEVCGESAAIREASFQPESWHEPWFFLSISCVGQEVTVNPSLMREAMALANRHGSSRIIVNTPGKKGLIMGLLNRRRWWTITRARLCAQHVIRNHLTGCGLPEGQ